MTRWSHVAGEDRAETYAARFDALAASGAEVHGEADFCDALLRPRSRVLDAGCGTGRVAIELARRGHACVGVDVEPSMLAVAGDRAPDLPWVRADLCELDPQVSDVLSDPFDLVVAAGNVVPLVAAGTEPAVVANLATLLRPGGLLVAGFGLDPAHLPVAEATVGLEDYDRWCSDAGLTLEQRFATWDGDPYEGGGYAVSVHRRPA